jgi:hypothetical protein
VTPTNVVMTVGAPDNDLQVAFGTSSRDRRSATVTVTNNRAVNLLVGRLPI